MNLSCNSFLGLTPESFSNLTDVESLDLSFNMLWGPILQNLGKLYNMVVFNVSYNNLSAPFQLPSQGKFSTLDESNYIANPHLCGSDIKKVLMITNLSFLRNLIFKAEMTKHQLICIDSSRRRAWFRLVDGFIRCLKCV